MRPALIQEKNKKGDRCRKISVQKTNGVGGISYSFRIEHPLVKLKKE